MSLRSCAAQNEFSARRTLLREPECLTSSERFACLINSITKQERQRLVHDVSMIKFSQHVLYDDRREGIKYSVASFFQEQYAWLMNEQ